VEQSAITVWGRQFNCMFPAQSVATFVQ
jgi:O-glycosyl hydrolase